MAVLKPKDFIKQVFIDELEPLAQINHYISFAIMATGIEFLGKCLDSSASNWNISGRSERNFKSAITTLPALSRYRSYDELLFDALRCGFAHSFVPKYGITLSSKNELGHMVTQNERLNLKCEDFYQDFKQACHEVIGMTFPNLADKMNKDLIEVPENKFNELSQNQSAVTESFASNQSVLLTGSSTNTTSGSTNV